MKLALSAALLLAAAMPALAQQGGPVVGSVTPRYKELSTWLTQTAEQVPESLYPFRPNPAVRSLGQLIGHVANAQFMFCTAALASRRRRIRISKKSRTRPRWWRPSKRRRHTAIGPTRRPTPTR